MAIDKVSVPKKGVNVSPGSHVGLFVGLIHLGIQKTEFEGAVSYKDQVLLSFELPDVLLDDGRPVTLSKTENHSLGARANLLKAAVALNGGKSVDDGIDWESMVGKPLMLQVKENKKKTGVNISGYAAIPEVYKKNLKPLMNEPRMLLDVETISEKELKGLPEWVQKMISKRVKEEGDVDPSIDY